ncbi:MAG: hypothetical protein K0R67_469 [Paenibacillus sp.]|jgi:hypothetical protein|nr:hypothetical protein [Paenibacillus sp.]
MAFRTADMQRHNHVLGAARVGEEREKEHFRNRILPPQEDVLTEQFAPPEIYNQTYLQVRMMIIKTRHLMLIAQMSFVLYELTHRSEAKRMDDLIPVKLV